MKEAMTLRSRAVESACTELGLSDWMKGSPPEVSLDDAATLQAHVGAEALQVPVEAFRKGLEVELEHGTRFQDANVTDGHPVLTAQIVLAHLKESLLYYEGLDVAELEGDLLKAVQEGGSEKVQEVYRKLLRARIKLAERQLEVLHGS